MSRQPLIQWDFRRHGRRWTSEEADVRFDWTPEKIEFVGIFTDNRARMR